MHYFQGWSVIVPRGLRGQFSLPCPTRNPARLSSHFQNIRVPILIHSLPDLTSPLFTSLLSFLSFIPPLTEPTSLQISKSQMLTDRVFKKENTNAEVFELAKTVHFSFYIQNNISMKSLVWGWPHEGASGQTVNGIHHLFQSSWQTDLRCPSS